MGMTDKIEAFICQLMKEDDGWVELGRNELAGIFNCVPSQINYVISTRFTPEKGYSVESRRGGGGYIKIRKLLNGIGDVVASIPDSISCDDAVNIIKFAASNNMIKIEEAKLMAAAVGSININDVECENKIRSDILKKMLTVAAGM